MKTKKKLREIDLQRVAFYLSLINLTFTTIDHLRAQYARGAAQVRQSKNKKKTHFGFVPPTNDHSDLKVIK